MVLFDSIERQRLRALIASLETKRDQVAELDLEIETLRDELYGFEETYRGRLAQEHAALKRVELLVRHFDRWTELLEDATRKQVVKDAPKLDRKRGREVADLQRTLREAPKPTKKLKPEEPVALEAQSATTALGTHSDRLKAAYRALARKYHPDLARTEEERLRAGEVMARINALYKTADLPRLEALAEQAKGGELEDADLPVDEQLTVLQERADWFDTVLQNLRDERAALERSPSCELWRNVELAAQHDRDLIEEVRAEMVDRVQGSFKHVRGAALRLEAEIMRYNREAKDIAQATRPGALEKRFDPFADKAIVRLGLEELATLSAPASVKKQADSLEDLAADNPGLLRLVLLTYVSELSPFPLPGLTSYDDIAARLALLGEKDFANKTLDALLAEGDALVEYGVRRATETVVHTGLRFRAASVRDAVPVLLKSLLIRREFRKILSVLGEREKCPACKKEIFTTPLFRTHGLDDLRANVCPKCTHVLRSYWMPKGKDVQAVLNSAFLDFELLTEWSLVLGRASVGIQLLPKQVESLRVGDLKERFVADVLTRYAIEIEAVHVALLQDGKRVNEKAKLADFQNHSFTVQFSDEAKMREADALELIRHRVRARFRGG